MQSLSRRHDRRRFLRHAIGAAGGLLLAGCGSGGGTDDGAGVPLTAAPTPAPTPVAGDRLNLALNLAYLGAQFYGQAAHGTGLPAALTTGIGEPGAAMGARRAAFGDPLIADHAAALADDKAAHVAALRDRMGARAAAQPVLDLSADATGAFSLAAQAAGLVAAGGAFDPYAGDDNFLLGAFLVENAVAAAYRSLLAGAGDPADAALVAATLGDAIYHGGLVRSLLDDRSGDDPLLATAATQATTLFAALDGSDRSDQSLAGAAGASSNLTDAAGRPIPFTRGCDQVLRTLYLSAGRVGGFLPAGANGIADRA